MNLHAFVLHNVSPDMFFRYDPKTSHLHHAHTLQVEADSPELACDLIWTLTNVDSADDLRLRSPHLARYAEQVTAYRERRNRSLSVGDVVVLFERERPLGSWAVAPFGFDALADVGKPRTVTNDRPISDAYIAHMEYRGALDEKAILESVRQGFGG